MSTSNTDERRKRRAAEIARLRARIARWEREVDSRFPFTPGVDVCCPSCKWGREYADECDQQERREAWLEILKGKPIP